MTAPALARGQERGRRYQWPPGLVEPELIVPSVTTILGQMSKGDKLTNWAAKEVATFAVDNILYWQNLPPRAAVDMLKRSPYRNMVDKQEIGTAVHTAIDLWTQGESHIDGTGVPVIDNLDLLPYIGGAVSFMEDHVTTVIHSEATIFNRRFQYAGTLDIIAELKDGRTAIVDWKTGRDIYPEVALQLCAYAHGDFIGDENGNMQDLPTVDLGLAIHLPGNGTYTAREIILTDRMWKTFQALRTLQAWKDDHERYALGKSHKGSTNPVDAVTAKRQQKQGGK